MARPRPALIVIVGPIAAGKSTLAAAVAQRLRARGEAVAVVGLDSVAEMALPTLDWEWAHEVHGHLVRAWLALTVRTVIAEGPSTAAEVGQLMRCVPRDVDVLTVVLTTRYEVAMRRAEQDPDRGISKDPNFPQRGSRPVPKQPPTPHVRPHCRQLGSDPINAGRARHPCPRRPQIRTRRGLPLMAHAATADAKAVPSAAWLRVRRPIAGRLPDTLTALAAIRCAVPTAGP